MEMNTLQIYLLLFYNFQKKSIFLTISLFLTDNSSPFNSTILDTIFSQLQVTMALTLAYFRIFVYIFTIIMHMSNMLMMGKGLENRINDIPELKAFSKLQPRYFTCWTFFLQIVHAVVGLFCECLLLVNSKEQTYKLPKRLKGFKNTLFSAILWPSTCIVVTVFWSLYLYDRRLIYPSFVDKVLTSTSNHIMHTAILPIVLWEVACQPRPTLRSHRRNLQHLTFHLLLYFVVLTYTYMEKGIWIYPIFSVLYGTIYFPLIHISIAALGLLFYYIQWPMTGCFYGQEVKIKSNL